MEFHFSAISTQNKSIHSKKNHPHMNSRTRDSRDSPRSRPKHKSPWVCQKKKKKENVKINDFESEFCTAKTAFNEKSLIQLWIMVVETWWFQWLCGLQTMTELWLLYIKEWLKIVLKNCNGQRATIWNIEANAGRNGKGKNLKILRKKYTFYPTKVLWEDLKLIIFGVK